MDDRPRLTSRFQIGLLIIFSALLGGCTYFRSDSEKPNTSAFDTAQIQKEMAPLNLKTPYHPTKEIAAYFDFYQLNPPDVKHYFGTISSKNSTLATHVFIPKNPKGTLFLIHGYFDHTGTFSRLISKSLAHHYAVVSWDLPGHGLSTGDRTDTGAFALCGEQFIDIVQRAETHLPAPFFLVTHSTGCSIALEYIQHAPTNTFSQFIFLSPLIRHAHWGWGKFGYTIAKPFVKTIRRREKKNSSDSEYLAFVKQDPLHSGLLSFEYLDDLYTWEKQIQKNSVWPESVLIIQGDHDTVVDWKYNLKFLRTKIKHPEIHIIPNARHQLINESEEFRNQVFTLIFQQLESTETTPTKGETP